MHRRRPRRTLPPPHPARSPLLAAAALLAALALSSAIAAAAPPAHAAKRDHARSVAAAKVVKARIARPATGSASLLVAVRYPIQLAGRRGRLATTLRGADGRVLMRRRSRPLLSSGARRSPERRRAFAFVHRIDLGPRAARLLAGSGGPGGILEARIDARLDADRDGRAELRSGDVLRRRVPLPAASRRLCSTLPLLRGRPGRRVAAPLPVCGAERRWRIVGRPQGGTAKIEAGQLVYRPAPGFRGSEAVSLSGGARARVQASAAAGAVVRAIGDSVTAGFGYYNDGSPMPFADLWECRPPEREYDDACSSNSVVTSDAAKEVVYAPDYGLSNDVSWAAQWANEHGIGDYQNLAVSGSEPKDWAPGGQFYAMTARLEAEDPDYVLLTLGANPLLSEMLFGAENMGCAISSDILGGYRECIERAFAGVALRANLERLYRDLVAKTDATVYLMQYHLSVPSVALAYTATQIAEMGALLNAEIAAAAAAVEPRRLRPVAPPHFDVGIDISPVYPSRFSCSEFFGYTVDGPSVQSEPTQDELAVLHPLSFCEGPVSGPPWVISGDTGIHPSAAGYAQMAAQIPAPAPAP